YRRFYYSFLPAQPIGIYTTQKRTYTAVISIPSFCSSGIVSVHKVVRQIFFQFFFVGIDPLIINLVRQHFGMLSISKVKTDNKPKSYGQKHTEWLNSVHIANDLHRHPTMAYGVTFTRINEGP